VGPFERLDVSILGAASVSVTTSTPTPSHTFRSFFPLKCVGERRCGSVSVLENVASALSV
jgi:hypothetical protein